MGAADHTAIEGVDCSLQQHYEEALVPEVIENAKASKPSLHDAPSSLRVALQRWHPPASTRPRVRVSEACTLHFMLVCYVQSFTSGFAHLGHSMPLNAAAPLQARHPHRLSRRPHRADPHRRCRQCASAAAASPHCRLLLSLPPAGSASTT